MKFFAKFGLFMIVVALIGGGIYAGYNQLAVGGGTVLSVDNARFLSNNEELSGEDAYLVDVVVNRGGEEVVGEITPEQIEQYGIEKVPEGKFSLSFELQDLSCDYSYSKDDDSPFYKIYQATSRSEEGLGNSCPYSLNSLDLVEKMCRGEIEHECNRPDPSNTCYYGRSQGYPTGTGLTTPSSSPNLQDCDILENIQETPARPQLQDASEWCYSSPPSRPHDSKHWRVTHVAGAKRATGYEIGTTPNPEYKIKLTLTNSKGENTTTTITSNDDSVMLDGIGRVKLAGGNIGDQLCQQPAINYALIKKLRNNTFKQVEKSTYQRYQDNLQQLIDFDNNYFKYENVDPGTGADVLWDRMSSLNSDLTRLLNENVENDCKVEGSKYTCIPDSPVVYPELQLLLKSDWVGVRSDTSKPQILDKKIVDNQTSGEVNNVQVDLTNEGNVDDTFQVDLVCDGRSVLFNPVRTSISPGQVKQVRLNYILNRPGRYDCTVQVESVNNPLMSDQEQVSFSMSEDEEEVQVEQCEDVSNPPGENCFWQGYPECSWKCRSPEVQGVGLTNILVMAGVAVIAFFILLYYFIKKN